CHFRIIYGHLVNPIALPASGQMVVTPDTQLGEIDPDPNGELHTHIEIRDESSNTVFIRNPLLFLPEVMRNAIFAKFAPNGDFHTPGLWQSPLDQPKIQLAKKDDNDHLLMIVPSRPDDFPDPAPVADALEEPLPLEPEGASHSGGTDGPCPGFVLPSRLS